jgi:hypothetical protein
MLDCHSLMKAKHSSVKAATLPPPGDVYRLTYSNAGPDDAPQLFKDRDALAFCELAAALAGIGYRYGTTIFLYPGDERKLAEFPKFRPSDVLVMTTRPPIHDEGGLIPPRRKVIRAANPEESELQAILFGELLKYFAYSTRKHMELAAHSLQCLRPAERQKWQHVELYKYYIPTKTHSAAEVLRHFVGPEAFPPDPTRHSSIAFFLRLNQVRGINCDFVASFGMDAYSTLIWNRMIRMRHADWLASPRFVAAELIYKTPIPPRPLTPEFNDNGDYVDIHLLT